MAPTTVPGTDRASIGGTSGAKTEALAEGGQPGLRQSGETVWRRLRLGDSSEEEEGWLGRGPVAVLGSAEKGLERHALSPRRQGTCSCLGRSGLPWHGRRCLRDNEEDAVGRG